MPRGGSVLSGREIRELILRGELIRGAIDLDVQVTPNGFDLSLKDIYMFTGAGRVDFSNVNRKISEVRRVEARDGVYFLDPGAYKVVFNEVISLPKDMVAFGAPRSSLLRCGVMVACAVFDAGYYGRSEALMVVGNPYGFTVEQGARIVQLTFIRIGEETEGYRGQYLGENL